ncbi:solute carrier family 10 (sodium/bile acid cotransporter), member 7 [Salegentibacter holothuriorum]|uniref:Solute carrier family 10 (Sodium/bile acid cotransporter), member 7 n=1 Tax=Salegentibacter holothuriorum TaxID=241145 RepID=A0A1T5AIH7_9FLAO|nr:bile acid:sodium symporter family protein [Salegentibacter holothuriorum]SKB34822.1 solute carrier family 10 (sodium/bile acid cotransporter), member 7 [Salegentibacter holothuriorum]
MKFNGFIAVIFLAIIIAYLFPEGIVLFPLKTITDIGIGFIFFFYGLKLSPAEFKLGLLNYKVHIVIQLATFVVFPLLTLLFLPLFEKGTGSDLWIALFFLGTLPSTVSSSIVMVSLAKGNLPTAIFNASLSGLIGIFVTPIWLSFFLSGSADFEFLDVLIKLCSQIIIPLILGLMLQKFLGDFARKHNKKLGLLDKTTIILIVYSSFSNSFSSNIFSSVETQDLLKLTGIVVLLFFVVYFGLGLLCKVLGFNLKNKITTQFCGTKKSLVHGSVMVKVIFGNSANTGLLLLPIMIYHSLQLILIAFYAEKYRKQVLRAETLEETL